MNAFTTNWSYRTGEVTIDFKAGDVTTDADILIAAQEAGAIPKELNDGDGNDNRPAKGSAKGNAVFIKD